MSQDNSASISFNINLPREIVQDYFEGLAKVEKAKAQNPSNSSQWLAALAPLVAALVSKESTKKTASKEKKLGDDIADLISEIITPGSKTEPEPVPCSSDESGPSNNEDMSIECNACFFQAEGPCRCDCDDLSEKFAQPAEEKKPEGKPADTQTEGKKEEAPKRAVYEEPDPSEPPPNPFANMTEMFNGEGMTEMMKNFQPMVENFQQMFNGKGAGMAPKSAGPKSRGMKKTAKKPKGANKKKSGSPPPVISSLERKGEAPVADKTEEPVSEVEVKTDADVKSDLDVKADKASESAPPATSVD